jgi:rod shape-determining protein MreC
MATSYRRVRSTRLLVVGLLLASLVTITVDSRGGQSGALAAIGRTGAAIITPLQEGIATVFRPVGSFLSNVWRAGSLAEENRALREQIGLLQREQQEILSLRRENEEFQRLLGISESLEFETMGAVVTGEVPSNFEWGVFIDKGADDGVTVDMPVMSGEGLVGRVVQVYPTSSKVMLIIDPDSAVAARLSASGERGVLVGQREEPLRFDFVDLETEVQPGETVETSGYQLQSGLEGLFPPGIPIGVVDRVEPDEANFTAGVVVRPNVDFSRLDFVLLVTEAPAVVEEQPAAGEETPAEPREAVEENTP